METEVKKLYEALFLVDSAEAASDWEGVNESIKRVLDRVEADIVSIRKWDERPLAYEINGKKRGTYILVYFNADGSGISTIEREVQLSERIMRVLILKGDHLTEEDMQKDTPAAFAEKAAEAQAEEKKESEAKKEADAAAKVADVPDIDIEDKFGQDVATDGVETEEELQDECEE